MRSISSLWNVASAFLAMAGLILTAGVASAQFFNDYAYAIDPDSPGYDGSDAWVEASGDNYSAGVEFYCTDIDNDFYIGCETTHPDSVNVSKNQGKVDQKKNNNNAYAYMSVGEMGGEIEETEFELSCEKVQVMGMANIQNDKVKVQCALKGCEIPGGLTLNQIDSAVACINAAEDSGDLGKKVQSLKLNNNNRLNGKVKAAGMAYWD